MAVLTRGADAQWGTSLQTPPKDKAVLDFSFSYSSTTRLVKLSATGGDYLYLLGAYSPNLKDAFGVTAPTTMPGAAATTLSTAVMFSTKTGFLSLNLGVKGAMSMTKVGSYLGLTWTAPEMATMMVSDPAVQYTKSPASLTVALTLDVPALNIASARATLRVLGGGAGSTSLEVRHELRPLAHMSSVARMRRWCTQVAPRDSCTLTAAHQCHRSDAGRTIRLLK
jgi:hypothetical protein